MSIFGYLLTLLPKRLSSVRRSMRWRRLLKRPNTAAVLFFFSSFKIPEKFVFSKDPIDDGDTAAAFCKGVRCILSSLVPAPWFSDKVYSMAPKTGHENPKQLVKEGPIADARDFLASSRVRLR